MEPKLSLPDQPSAMPSPQNDEWRRKLSQRWKDLTDPYKTYKESDERRFPAKWQQIKQWSFDKNLVIIGKSGSCKTRMAYQLIRKQLHERQMMANVIHDAMFAVEVGDAAFVGKVKEKIEPFMKTPLLLIDDLGKAPSTERYICSLYAIAEDRYARGYPTIITTQMNPKQQSEKLAARGDLTGSEAILRRFTGEAIIIEL